CMVGMSQRVFWIHPLAAVAASQSAIGSICFSLRTARRSRRLRARGEDEGPNRGWPGPPATSAIAVEPKSRIIQPGQWPDALDATKTNGEFAGGNRAGEIFGVHTSRATIGGSRRSLWERFLSKQARRAPPPAMSGLILTGAAGKQSQTAGGNCVRGTCAS